MSHERNEKHQPKFAVAEVVRLTGLTTQLLHTWERRYGVVQPNRDDSGARAYSENEILRLQMLKQCVDGGHRIGKLASLTASELKLLASPADLRTEIPHDDLVGAAEKLDAEFLEYRLSAHFSTLGPVRFARDVVAPLLRSVGTLWEQKKVSTAGEHLVSSTVRTLLGQALSLTRRQNDGPPAVFATPEGELHELGALCAAVCAQCAGIRAIYLGAQLPAKEAERACSTLGSTLVVLSISNAPTERLIGRIADVSSRLPDGVELWLGGAAAGILGKDQVPDAIIIEDFFAFKDAIQRFRIRRMQSRPHWTV